MENVPSIGRISSVPEKHTHNSNIAKQAKDHVIFWVHSQMCQSDVHQRSTGLSQEVSYELTTFWHLSGSGCLISMVFCIFIFRKMAINDLKGSFLSSGFGLWGDTKKGRSHVQKEISTKRFSFSCFKLALFSLFRWPLLTLFL